MTKIVGLMDQLDLPKGVLNLVQGGREVVDGILEHPDIKGISFVGSSTCCPLCLFQRRSLWKTCTGTRRGEKPGDRAT